MSSLSIGRLHARYVDVDDEDVRLLDGVVRDLVRGSLERAAREVFGGSFGGTDDWAVCVSVVEFDVELDLTCGRGVLADVWARELAQALRRSLETPLAHGETVVRYRTEQAALAELVVGVARGRVDRCWAWRQVGLIRPGASVPTGIDVADALAARPALAAAVIAACPTDAWRVIDPIGWIVIARAVSRRVGRSIAAPGGSTAPVADARHAALSASDPIETSIEAARTPESQFRPAPGLVERLVAAIPPSAWSAAEGADLAALASLAAAMLAPHVLRHRDLLDAVVARAGTLATRPQGADPIPSVERVVVASSATDGKDSHAEPSPPTAIASGFGGVWYLVRPIAELELAVTLARHDALRAPELLAAVVAQVTGASADDPAVALLAGTTEPIGTQLEHGDDELVDRLAAELVDALRRRGDGRLAERDLGELWRRGCEMTVELGEIVVRFVLDSVDIDVRALGLDADPGFVWWSGSIVRFEYV